MSKTNASPKRTLPESFRQRNQAQSQRVIDLTQKAIAQLEANHQAVTLNSVVAITQSLDDQRKGLSAKTILRNAEAATLFREHSLNYQVRQQKIKRAKRKRVRIDGETRSTYRGLRLSDLIQMMEDLKKQNVALQTQCNKLKAEREEAYRLRDEALEHNTRQLAALTRQK
ncbi:MAG: hypothetical protein HZB51_22520 [Chloroflexi bacterium]|nr:hypothetical protein [Chloroflexota bacterium]